MSALEDALLLRAATGFMFYGDEGHAFHVLPDESGEGEWIIVRTTTEHHPYVAHEKTDVEFHLRPAVLAELETTKDRTLRWVPWHPIHDTPDGYYCIRFSTLREACLRAMGCGEGKHEDYVDDASSWKKPWWSRPVEGGYSLRPNGFEEIRDAAVEILKGDVEKASELDRILLLGLRAATDLVLNSPTDLVMHSTPKGTERIFDSGEYHAHRLNENGSPGVECSFADMKEGDRFVLDYEPRGGGLGDVMEVFRTGSEGRKPYVDAFRVEDSSEGKPLIETLNDEDTDDADMQSLMHDLDGSTDGA